MNYFCEWVTEFRRLGWCVLLWLRGLGLGDHLLLGSLEVTEIVFLLCCCSMACRFFEGAKIAEVPETVVLCGYGLVLGRRCGARAERLSEGITHVDDWGHLRGSHLGLRRYGRKSGCSTREHRWL